MLATGMSRLFKVLPTMMLALAAAGCGTPSLPAHSVALPPDADLAGARG